MIPTSGLGITHPHPFTVLFLVAVFEEAAAFFFTSLSSISVSGLWNNTEEYAKWVRPEKDTFELHQNGCQATLLCCLWENVIFIYLQLPFWKIRSILVKNIRSKVQDRIFLSNFCPSQCCFSLPRNQRFTKLLCLGERGSSHLFKTPKIIEIR